MRNPFHPNPYVLSGESLTVNNIRRLSLETDQTWTVERKRVDEVERILEDVLSPAGRARRLIPSSRFSLLALKIFAAWRQALLSPLPGRV